MFLTIALVLIVLWALGFFIFPVAGGLVHYPPNHRGDRDHLAFP